MGYNHRLSKLAALYGNNSGVFRRGSYNLESTEEGRQGTGRRGSVEQQLDSSRRSSSSNDRRSEEYSDSAAPGKTVFESHPSSAYHPASGAPLVNLPWWRVYLSNMASLAQRRGSKYSSSASSISSKQHGPSSIPGITVSGPASLSIAGGPLPYDPPHHRIPLSLRIPALFRVRIPLIALIPVFLLGWLFAPLQRLDSTTNRVGGNTHNPTILDSDSEYDAVTASAKAANWAQRFLRPGGFASGALSGPSNPIYVDNAAHEHYTDEDGLLYFPPAAPSHVDDGVEAAYAKMPKQRHPILYLIEKAETDWADLLAKQSTSLDEAVKEYRRRYKRAPPKGFEKWWAFVQENNVQLPDEYDAIMQDIEPFHSLPPTIFKARAHQLAKDPDFHYGQQAFTMNVKDGSLEVTGPFRFSGRAEETKDLMDGFAHLLPDMHVTFTMHDGPGVVVSGEAKARHIAAARAGRLLTEREYTDADDKADFPGWTGACPPDSNWRRSLAGWSLSKPSTHSFISDVEESSDPCKHPNLASQHGFFLWNGPHMGLLYPLLTWAKTALHSDILVTPLEQYHMPVGPDPEWDDKRHNKLLWRGSNTGAAFNRESRWQSSQRCRLVQMTNEDQGERTLQYCDKDGSLRAAEEPVIELNARYTDVSFSGHPSQCDEGDGTCEALTRVFDFKGNMDLEENNNYKYIFDVDGNGWSGRFHRLMLSNSAVLKSTIMPEWYQQRIMPWVHYIPVKVDYTDLYDILGFFIGGPEDESGHDALGKRIARQGQQWTKENWREVDMQAYLFRLFLEYGRLLNRSEQEIDSEDYVSRTGTA